MSDLMAQYNKRRYILETAKQVAHIIFAHLYNDSDRDLNNEIEDLIKVFNEHNTLIDIDDIVIENLCTENIVTKIKFHDKTTNLRVPITFTASITEGEIEYE